MIIGIIEWVRSFLMSSENKTVASYCAVISSPWVNGSLMTHWPISISGCVITWDAATAQCTFNNATVGASRVPDCIARVVTVGDHIALWRVKRWGADRREIRSKSTERRTAFPVDRSCALWSKCRCPALRPTIHSRSTLFRPRDISAEYITRSISPWSRVRPVRRIWSGFQTDRNSVADFSRLNVIRVQQHSC